MKRIIAGWVMYAVVAIASVILLANFLGMASTLAIVLGIVGFVIVIEAANYLIDTGKEEMEDKGHEEKNCDCNNDCSTCNCASDTDKRK